ncbi:MAG: DNA methyltransferase, partial [Gemmobacter sp.]
MPNHLHYGDNLEVLRRLPAESVDLIYLDPPFNSNASYNQLFKAPDGRSSAAQVEAFEDTWHWGDAASAAYEEVRRHPTHSDAAQMIVALRSFLGENDMMAYLVMMAVRLIELHRVLKPTGSLYLHCDPTASHYLKILLDAVFGKAGYQNEVIWRRYKRPKGSQHTARRFGRSTDTILFYTKSYGYQFHADRIRQEIDSSEFERRYSMRDAKGPFMSGPLLRS